jgi:nicotinamide mononucleotide (NMN) deamidase PncC
VSAEAALVLARAAREVLRTTWAVAETGIAGPQVGRRSSKPVGLTYVAVAGLFAGQNVERVVEVFTGLGEREGNRRAFADAALSLLLACLEQLSEGST